MAVRKITLEEDDNQGGMPPPNAPPVMTNEDGGFRPDEHPWNDYGDQARIHISDMILRPQEDQLKEFTFMPQGILFEMVLGNTMVAMMKNYAKKDFNAAEYLINTVDQRLRGLDGKMVKYAVLLAGDESKNEDINPMSGPIL
jgi:hypothetical protein